MKRSRRLIITTFCLLILVVGAVLFFFLKEKPSSLPKLAQKPSPHAVPTPQSVTTATPTPTPDFSIYKTDPRWIWWSEQNARDPSFEWKMPINFYGKVIDENRNPVSDAHVDFIWNDLSPRGTSKAETLSDMQGLFSLTNKTGKLLQVRVNKEDYYSYSENRFSFEYAAFFESNYHQPDPNNPVIFRLRKKGEVPQHLVVRDALMSIKPTGEPQYIDLQAARKTAVGMGDIAISITRTALADVKQYDWSASVEGINGTEVLESNDEFMFEAPESGYEPGYEYRFVKSDPNWKNQMSQKYFVRARNGELYARLEIKFMPKYQDAAAVRIRFYANPTGSRNLEYDPHKVLPR